MRTIRVNSIQHGIEQAKLCLYEKIDRKTVLFLSGGRSTKPLYESLASEKKLFPAAVALIDDRYGMPFHDNSNEKMIRNTGLFTYFSDIRVPIHLILKENTPAHETSLQYEEEIRKLFFQIPKSFAIMSIGPDGHTAGLAPNRKDFINPIFSDKDKSVLVSYFHDKNGMFGKRITLTFQALQMMDGFLLWVFGKEKRNALGKMFSQGSLEELPVRFYTSGLNDKKTILITDQKL